MNADLLVEIPGHAPCAVQRKELVVLLGYNGWREIEPMIWISPVGHEPDLAFVHLSRSLMPRRLNAAQNEEIQQNVLLFRRRCDLGENVWVIG